MLAPKPDNPLSWTAGFGRQKAMIENVNLVVATLQNNGTIDMPIHPRRDSRSRKTTLKIAFTTRTRLPFDHTRVSAALLSLLAWKPYAYLLHTSDKWTYATHRDE